MVGITPCLTVTFGDQNSVPLDLALSWLTALYVWLSLMGTRIVYRWVLHCHGWQHSMFDCHSWAPEWCTVGFSIVMVGNIFFWTGTQVQLRQLQQRNHVPRCAFVLCIADHNKLVPRVVFQRLITSYIESGREFASKIEKFKATKPRCLLVTFVTDSIVQAITTNLHRHLHSTGK